jgi:hypothetical protein
MAGGSPVTRLQCDALIEAYVDWLRRGISARTLEEGCLLITPFLDRHNDHFEVYAYRKGPCIVLTDDGYTLADLRSSGVELDTPARKALVDEAFRALGVRVENRALVVEASDHDVGQKLHFLVQAMLFVNDTFMTARPRVETFFWEDVRQFLDANAIRFTPRVKFSGQTGFDHAIDFVVPKSATQSERILQTITSPSRNTIMAYLFALTDTRGAREGASKAYAVLNDREQAVAGDVVDALNQYSVVPLLWSKREQFVGELAA